MTTRAPNFLGVQLVLLALHAASIFVAVSWSQFIGELIQATLEREAQLGRIAVAGSVCVVSYAISVAFLYRFVRNGETEEGLIFVFAIGELVAMSFRDLVEECVGILDDAEAKELRLHRNGRLGDGHGINAGEADFATVGVVLALGICIVLALNRLRRRDSPLHAHLLEIEVAAFAICSAWAINDAFFRTMLSALDPQARVWACAVFVLVALSLAERAVVSFGLLVQRRAAPSADLILLDELHGQTWAFVLGLGLAYLLGDLHRTDGTRYGRFITASLVSLLAIAGAVVTSRTVRACARNEFQSLESLVQATPHVRWPSELGAWRQRRRRDADQASSGRISLSAVRAMCATLGARTRAAMSSLTEFDGSEALLAGYSLDTDFMLTVRTLREQQPGAFVVYEGIAAPQPQQQPAAPLSACYGGEPALVLVRTNLGPLDVLVVPILRLANGNWTTAETHARSVRSQLGALALSIAKAVFEPTVHTEPTGPTEPTAPTEPAGPFEPELVAAELAASSKALADAKPPNAEAKAAEPEQLERRTPEPIVNRAAQRASDEHPSAEVVATTVSAAVAAGVLAAMRAAEVAQGGPPPIAADVEDAQQWSNFSSGSPVDSDDGELL